MFLKIRNFTLVLTFIFCFLITSSTLAQEAQQRVNPYYPTSSSLEDLPIQNLKSEIKGYLESSPVWTAYRAALENDLDVCEFLKSKEACGDCQEMAGDFIFIRSLARSRCDALSGKYSNFKDLCQASTKGDCSSLKGYKKLLCEGFLDRDLRDCIAAFKDRRFPYSISDKREACERYLNLYYGFKMDSEYDCDEFRPNASLLRRLSCKVLVGHRDPDTIIDKLATDIAYFGYAKDQKKEELCGKIRNTSIKKACYDPAMKDVRVLLDNIWRY